MVGDTLLKDRIVTIDAMMAATEIVAKVVESNAAYILEVE